MEFGNFRNFLFVPSSEKIPKHLLYILKKTETFSNNIFFLCPYQNPQVKELNPEYFKIEGILAVNDDPFKKFAQKSSPLRLKARTSKQDYISKVKALKDHIQKGNI